MFKKPLGLACMLGLFTCVDSATAHTLRSRSSVYEDSGGISRNRYKMDLGFNLTHDNPTLTNSTYALSASSEELHKDNIEDDEYFQKYFASGRRQTDTVTINTSHTWAKLNETRFVGSHQTDGVMTSSTGGAGYSRWFWHENLQLGFDISRTIVRQPLFETLGADSDVMAAPELVSSTGTNLTAKILANPTTVTTLTYAHIEKNDRPPANIYNLGVKQFIPPTKSAVHVDVGRAYNQGRVTNKTTYGEVDAWIAEFAFLQNLWRGGTAKASYRYYKEDESTRVDGDRFVRGSDLYSLFLAHEIPKNTAISNLGVPLVIEISASEYRTNELEDGKKLSARIYEAGLLAKF